jgi:type VI secretion system protein VasG
MGRFLLVGPNGVGKTETARALAKILYGGERHMITLNLSDYQEAYTVSSLTGTPLGPVGYSKEGTLLKTVRQQPYCVLLLEEIEQAHPTFIKFLTQVFDKGTLENDSGLRVDFKNTMILLTSKLGKEIITRLCNAPGYSPSQEKLIDALNPLLLQHFQPEFLKHLAVVPYHPLGDLDLRRIIKLKLTQLQQRFREKYQAQLTYSDSLLDAIANRCSEVDSGAHNINLILTDTLLPSLSTNLLGYQANGQTFSTVHLSCDDLGKLGAQFDTSLELPLAEKEPETVKKSANQYQSNELIDDLNEVLEFVKI